MHFDKRLFIILIAFLFINIAVVSAEDANSTLEIQLADNDTFEVSEIENTTDDVGETNSTGNDTEIEKTTPKITLESKKVNSKDTLEIYLTNSSGNPFKSKKIVAEINNKKYSLTTNSKGIAKLNINLAAKTYKLTISFEGDDNYTSFSKVFSIKVIKLKTKITESANFVVRGKYLYFYLTDSNGNGVSGKKITIKYKKMM